MDDGRDGMKNDMKGFEGKGGRKRDSYSCSLFPDPCRRSSSGFTLLEVVLVMVILTIFAAVTIPTLAGRLPRARVERGAADVVAYGKKARAEAVLTGGTCRLVIDADARTMHLERESDPFREADQWEPVPGGWGVPLTFGDGVEIDTGETGEFVFHPHGGATGGTIEIFNEREDRVTVEIDDTTGRVHIPTEEDDEPR